MAQEKGPIATAGAPLATPSAPSPSATPPIATAESLGLANDPNRPRPLKRPRETTPTSPDLSSGGDLSPSKIARLVGYARQSSPPSLTGATGLEEERRRREEEQQRLEHQEGSPNPTHRALAELMSGVEALSRPQDMSAASDSSHAVEAASIAVAQALSAASMSTSNPGHAEPQEVSPHSAPASAVSRETLSEGPGEVVHSPAAMDIDSRSDQRLYAQQPDAQMDDKGGGSLSYPGAMQSGNQIGAPAPPRGMSLPMSGSQNQELSPRSPTSNKKHKCQFCYQEFTRHHNLKSHMLTHSQEKPYVCQTCNMRFRRLHDLKRHGKLHTGEKPHICPKCDRKFARGDALARHSKGAGGCAGRRPSMGGSFADDDYDTSGLPSVDDSAMTGVLYENAAAVDMTEEERRRLSLPSIKAQHVPGQPPQEGYVTHSNTYPPAGPRPPHTGGLYPPNVDRGSASATASPSAPNSHTPHTSVSSVPVSASSMYSQGGMTESPRPLSPGANQAGQDAALARQRSPQQQHFRQPDQAASGLSLPAHGMSPRTKQAWLSQYPPADRNGVEGATAPTNTSPTQAAARGRGRAASGANAGHVTNGIPPENTGVFVNSDVWAYIQQLEGKFRQMVDDQETLKRENAYLREKLTEHEHHFAALANDVAILKRLPHAPEPQHHQQHIQQQQPEAQPEPQPQTHLQQLQPPAQNSVEQEQSQQEVQVEEQPPAHTQPLAAPAVATPVAQP
ncbi:transcriptional regulator prz1 [Naviculisporaceae sp. PSN 640]